MAKRTSWSVTPSLPGYMIWPMDEGMTPVYFYCPPGSKYLGATSIAGLTSNQTHGFSDYTIGEVPSHLTLHFEVDLIEDWEEYLGDWNVFDKYTIVPSNKHQSELGREPHHNGQFVFAVAADFYMVRGTVFAKHPNVGGWDGDKNRLGLIEGSNSYDLWTPPTP